MNQAFSTYFKTNGTHLKCYSNEEWAMQWTELGYPISCNTSNLLVANFGWR